MIKKYNLLTNNSGTFNFKKLLFLQMQFDPNNPVIKLCADGMNSEAQGQIEKAKQLFQQAWDNSSSDFEKFTSAHYLARKPGKSKG